MDSGIMLAELTKIIPVIVGGLIAITGGVGGNILSHALSEGREGRKLICEKAEKIIEALYEHRIWVASENNRLVFGSEITASQSPLDRATAIQELYFPVATDTMLKITSAMIPITSYFYDQAQDRLKNKANWVDRFDGNEFRPLWESYLNASHLAVKEIVKLARIEIKA